MSPEIDEDVKVPVELWRGRENTLVRKVTRLSDGKFFACKTMIIERKDTFTRKLIEREHDALMRLCHDHIVGYEDIQWQDFDDDYSKVSLYMEWCEGDTLQQLIEDCRSTDSSRTREFISEITIWNIISQLSKALAYCHYGTHVETLQANPDEKPPTYGPSDWQMILHRDIKPANIMISNSVIKLIDFGFAFIIQEGRKPQSMLGSPGYQDPDIRNYTSGIPNPWSEKSDTYSMGCTIYALCNLEPPPGIMASVDLPEFYTKDLHDLVSACLNGSSRVRPDFVKIYMDAVRMLEALHVDKT